MNQFNDKLLNNSIDKHNSSDEKMLIDNVVVAVVMIESPLPALSISGTCMVLHLFLQLFEILIHQDPLLQYQFLLPMLLYPHFIVTLALLTVEGSVQEASIRFFVPGISDYQLRLLDLSNKFFNSFMKPLILFNNDSLYKLYYLKIEQINLILLIKLV